jgi:hypothetical protein
MSTYNKIIAAFDSFCTEHKQINTFYSGKTWNFQTETNVYPAVIMLPTTSIINKGQIVLSFNLFVADILNNDRTNLDEIYSDTLQILADAVSYFSDMYGEDNIDFYLDETNVTIEPFEEEFDDVLAGWMASIDISYPYSGSICSIPK